MCTSVGDFGGERWRGGKSKRGLEGGVRKRLEIPALSHDVKFGGLDTSHKNKGRGVVKG